MSFRSSHESAVQVIGKKVLFVPRGDPHLLVYFDVVDNVFVPLLGGTLFIDRFVEEVFPWNAASCQSSLAQLR